MFSDLISGIVWVTSVSYNWSMVSKVTVNQLQLSKITQTIPDILASNTGAQSSLSFWSGQLSTALLQLEWPKQRDITLLRRFYTKQPLIQVARKKKEEEEKKA